MKKEEGGFTNPNKKNNKSEGLYFATHCAISGEQLSEPIKCLSGEFVIKSKYKEKVFPKKDSYGFPYCRNEKKDFLNG